MCVCVCPSLSQCCRVATGERVAGVGGHAGNDAAAGPHHAPDGQGPVAHFPLPTRPAQTLQEDLPLRLLLGALRLSLPTR